MVRVVAAYGVVLVVLLALTRRLEDAGWTGVGALEIAGALADALLVLALAAAALLAGRLGLERWGRSMARWRRARALAAEEAGEAEVIGVTSWRPGRRPLPPPAEPAPAPPPQPAAAGFTYVGPTWTHGTSVAPPFPERRGSRL